MTIAMTRGISVVVVGAASLLLAAGLRGAEGARGAALGVGVGIGLCALSHVIVLGARKRPEQLGLFTVLGVLASFASLALAIVVIGLWLPPLLIPASLTAFCVYGVFRAFEVYEVSRVFSASSPAGEERTP